MNLAGTYLVGIEIWIEDNDGIRAPQVDSDSASSRGEKVDENIRPRTIELVHPSLTLRLLCVSILIQGKRGSYGHMQISLTSRKYLAPSPSRKSSIISKAMTNYTGCISSGNRFYAM